MVLEIRSTGARDTLAVVLEIRSTGARDTLRRYETMHFPLYYQYVTEINKNLNTVLNTVLTLQHTEARRQGTGQQHRYTLCVFEIKIQK